MTRNFKALGLAAFALLAFGAMVAPGAQAEVTLTAGKTSPFSHTAANVHAVQLTGGPTTNVFVVDKVPLTCSNTFSTFVGTIANPGTAKDLTISPHYTHCNVISSTHTQGTPATVTTNGCTFTFNQPETLTGGPKYTGTVDVVCPAGKVIEVHVYGAGTHTAHSVPICTVNVGAQANISHVVYENTTNAGKNDDIDVEVTAAGIEYSKTGLCGAKEGGDATYNSSLTLTSTNHDIWISDK